MLASFPGNLGAAHWPRMKYFTPFLLGLSALLSCAAAGEFKVGKRIPLPGDGSWDYLTVDAAARRLYVSHGTRVHVLDLDRKTVVGEIAPTPGVHGVALAPDLNRGFTSNGADATVTVFDLKTLATIQTLQVPGKKPDAILYDPFTKRLFTFNAGSDNATAFDAATGQNLGNIALGGGPEFAVNDGAGHCYVNLEEQSVVVRLDPQTLAVTARWPLAPGGTATALALDRENHRLLSACRSRNLMVLDSDTGAIVANVPIGGGVDSVALDPEHHRAYVGCGEGMVTVVTWTDADHYKVEATLPTQPGAKTLAFDPKKQRLYVSGAQFGPGEPPTGTMSAPHAPILPGTFGLLVFKTENKQGR
jgi:DNA-binding beta-propeller fold protein YncE